MLIILNDGPASTEKEFFYKIPVGVSSFLKDDVWINNNSKITANYVVNPRRKNISRVHMCWNTAYSVTKQKSLGARIDHPTLSRVTPFHKKCIAVKYLTFRPFYFSKFRYIGKGFKLLFKKKKRFLNCVFGHAHLYWVKLQSLHVKKIKKYRFGFVAKTLTTFKVSLSILRHVKPINRYTLRGVRTYKHVWKKHKGRKSIATHF